MKLIRFLAIKLNLSRRKIQLLITNKNVSVNGMVEESFSRKLENGDIINVNGKKIKFLNQNHKYFLFHKPKGVVISHKDSHNRTVFDILSIPRNQKFIFAGRLDKNSRGLMIMTTDGKFSDYLMSPKNIIEKEYLVKVYGEEFNKKQLRKMNVGIFDDGELLKFKSIQFEKRIDKFHRIYRIILTQGKKREIRRVVTHFGGKVMDLFRIRIDKYKINGIKSGEHKEFIPK